MEEGTHVTFTTQYMSSMWSAFMGNQLKAASQIFIQPSLCAQNAQTEIIFMC